MPRVTTTNSPTPHNVASAAHAVGCSENTIRNYVRSGLIEPQRTAGGTYIFYELHIEQARELYGQSYFGRARSGR